MYSLFPAVLSLFHFMTPVVWRLVVCSSCASLLPRLFELFSLDFSILPEPTLAHRDLSGRKEQMDWNVW